MIDIICSSPSPRFNILLICLSSVRFGQDAFILAMIVREVPCSFVETTPHLINETVLNKNQRMKFLKRSSKSPRFTAYPERCLRRSTDSVEISLNQIQQAFKSRIRQKYNICLFDIEANDRIFVDSSCLLNKIGNARSLDIYVSEFPLCHPIQNLRLF